METTLAKNKPSKNQLIKIGSTLLILVTCGLLFFTNNQSFDFIKNYFDNSNGINIVIIALIFLAPLVGFLIPYNKNRSQNRTQNYRNKNRRLIENRRKKELMRLMNANNKRF